MKPTVTSLQFAMNAHVGGMRLDLLLLKDKHVIVQLKQAMVWGCWVRRFSQQWHCLIDEVTKAT